MLAGFDQALGTFDRELRNARVALDVAVIRTGDNLGFRMRAFLKSVTSSGRSSTKRMINFISG